MILSSDLRFQERLRASDRRTAPTCSSSRGVVCELEEERQAGLRELHQPVPDLCPIAERSKVASAYGQGHNDHAANLWARGPRNKVSPHATARNNAPSVSGDLWRSSVRDSRVAA